MAIRWGKFLILNGHRAIKLSSRAGFSVSVIGLLNYRPKQYQWRIDLNFILQIGANAGQKVWIRIPFGTHKHLVALFHKRKKLCLLEPLATERCWMDVDSQCIRSQKKFNARPVKTNRKKTYVSSDKTNVHVLNIYDQWANDFPEFWRQMFVMVADFESWRAKFFQGSAKLSVR